MKEDLHPKTPPLAQIRATLPIMPSVLFAAIVVFMTSNGCPSVVTSNMFNPAPRSKLLNLTGFFSSLPEGEEEPTRGLGARTVLIVGVGGEGGRA